MELRSIENANFSDARVLVRTDFNIERTRLGEIEEHFRLEIVKKTIDHILSYENVKVALLTHLGRPEGKMSEEFSVKSLVPALQAALGREVVFVPTCVGEEVEKALETLPPGSVLLLENVRFFPGEEADDRSFAEALAKPFTAYVNEAFSVCHRAHASVSALPKMLPSYAGFRLLQEIDELDRVRFSPAHPAVAVIGGAKIETKLPLIHAFEKNYDCILVGGKVANEAIDQKIPFGEKVLLPQDFAEGRLDIGPNTIAYYSQILKMAKTIIWNGPLGKFEEKPYNMGTDAILSAILETDAYVVIGGGESLAVVERANVMNKIGFVSSGGGAMLDYLSGASLPGLEALKTS
ncbi:MAG: hypothetical protein A2808_00680 [Candidatus Moranbacteria bacterium RIFCSPHIGHO2_01_FULL_55_24]|nr:MAG: hypothetical protein A2808_00680 [Candidatus Moranbacteria bacterium RIFCSPHIGHO2_01_FULL_55_24]